MPYSWALSCTMLKQCTKEKTLVMCSIIKLVQYFCCTCPTHYNTSHKVQYFYTDTNKMVIRTNNIQFSEHIVSHAKEKKRKTNIGKLLASPTSHFRHQGLGLIQWRRIWGSSFKWWTFRPAWASSRARRSSRSSRRPRPRQEDLTSPSGRCHEL